MAGPELEEGAKIREMGNYWSSRGCVGLIAMEVMVGFLDCRLWVRGQSSVASAVWPLSVRRSVSLPTDLNVSTA